MTTRKVICSNPGADLCFETPQHDAMNMFHELAGPDGTMDDEEFSEILVFYKFNTRGLLSIDLGTSKSS